MPNGGYPRNQFIRPRGSSLALWVKGTEVLVFDAASLRQDPATATPLLVLSQEQTGALRSHLNYWFDYEAGYIPGHEAVDAVSYDY